MFRKIMLAVAATATIGAAALSTTAATAKPLKWGGWHPHHHHHWGFYGAPLVVGAGIYSGCWVKKWIDTPYGPRLRRVYVCY